MYRSILVGHDGRSGGEDALALGRVLADAGRAELVMGKIACNEGQGLGGSSPGRGLLELAEQQGADLLVIGASRRSRAGHVLTGQVGLGLLQGSPCAVAIAPKDCREREVGLSRLVVGFDGSDESNLALKDALELARAGGVEVRLVAVAPPPVHAYGSVEGYTAVKEAIEEHVREQLRLALRSIPPQVILEASLVAGDPATKLAEAALDASLLVLGSRAYGPVGRVLLGSVSAALVQSAACAVLVHPRAATPNPSPSRADGTPVHP
jgi:nucleotide-binding universal stress UspA family protein